jgi:hypothetical protein
MQDASQACVMQDASQACVMDDASQAGVMEGPLPSVMARRVRATYSGTCWNRWPGHAGP